MCIQTDKAAMSSPLGPTLGNIFVGYFEPKVISRIQKDGNLLSLCRRLNSAFWPVYTESPVSLVSISAANPSDRENGKRT